MAQRQSAMQSPPPQGAAQTARQGSPQPSPWGSRGQSIAPTQVVPPQVYRFQYHGSGKDLFWKTLKITLLTVITLGIYTFWAVPEMRRYFAANTEFSGQRFHYFGTVKEYFLSVLKGALVVLAAWGAGAIFAWLIGQIRIADPTGFIIFKAISGLLMLGFITLGTIAASFAWYAYMLSRIQIGGIRLGLAPNTIPYMKQVFIDGFLTMITLGIYTPWAMHNATKIFINSVRFGDQTLRYEGQAGELAKLYFKGMIFTVLTIGLYAPWSAAAIQRYICGHTCLMGARLKCDVRGEDLLVYSFGTAVMFSTGILAPWAITSLIRYHLDNLAFVGQIDFQSIGKGGQEPGSMTQALHVLGG